MIYQGCSIPEVTENALPICSGIALISPCLFFLKQILLMSIQLQKGSLILQCMLGFPSQSEGKGSSSLLRMDPPNQLQRFS